MLKKIINNIKYRKAVKLRKKFLETMLRKEKDNNTKELIKLMIKKEEKRLYDSRWIDLKVLFE